ncbi:MAG TPA: histidine kinase [Cyanothece sp. UBA12306]|nr:histidine kinase [Cyanothece sp. UBA12306]
MKLFNLIPKNWSIRKKITTLMLMITILGVIFSSIIYYNILISKAKNELNMKADMLISTLDSVRKYNNDRITPLLAEQSAENFLLESIPSFSIREVFNIFKNVYQENYGDFVYKDAMINPTNIKDLATEQEINIIKKLEQQDKLLEKNIDQGFMIKNESNYFYTARPIKITQKNCLVCHTTLKKSPKSLQVLYENGTYQGNQGFNWELNKVIGTKIIYVPASQVYQTAYQNFILMIGIFIVIFALSILLVNLWLKRHIIRPINHLTKVAEAISLGDMEVNFQKQSDDEVGRLADAFTRMKTSLDLAMKRLIRKSNSGSDQST